jgi:hypothetical protein
MSADGTQKQRYWQKLVSLPAIAVFGAIIFTSTIPSVQAQAIQRPLSDFLSAQGTTMIFTPPARDQIGFTTGIGKTNGNAGLTPTRFALVDYAGLEAKYLLLSSHIDLRTTVNGTVTERPLADGSALVTVDVHTTNALGWAMNWDPNGPDTQFNSAPLLFGARVLDVAVGKAPALGDSHLTWQFVNSAPGAPIPDLVVAIHTGSVATELLSIQASITGQLHAPEFTEGAAGRLGITEIGPIQAHNSNAGPLSDGYPVEAIDLTPLGH